MSLEKSHPRHRRSGVESEEERAWVGFYQRVSRDPAIATEVMVQFESDPEMKRTHLALYLCCKESLRQHKIRQMRNKRIGQFVRWLCHSLFARPWHSLQKGLHHGSDIAVECLPEAVKEPAVAQVRRLARDDEFSAACTVFEQQTGQSVTDPVPASAKTQSVPATKKARATA